MADVTERHEIRVRGKDHTIVFLADSEDGRLIIKQEPDGKKNRDVCAITLSDPDELRSFFKGLHRVLASLGFGPDRIAAVPAPAAAKANREDERDAVVEKARQRNPQAFAPWTPEEEQKVRKRHESGESIPAIARAHKRSPRAIELRLQRMGVLHPEE
jgi:hypothetical protein